METRSSRNLHAFKNLQDVYEAEYDETVDELTLSQLKKLSKKRKRSSSVMDSGTKQVYEKVESIEDEPLINWKLKTSKKNSNTIRKRTKTEVSRLKKSNSENMTQVNGELMVLINVPGLGESVEDSFMNKETIKYENKEEVVKFTPDQFQSDSSREDIVTDESENSKQIEEDQVCIVNEVSYEHLESRELYEGIVHVSNEINSSESSLALPQSGPAIEEFTGPDSEESCMEESFTKGQNPNMFSCSENSSIVLEIPIQNNYSFEIEDVDKKITEDVDSVSLPLEEESKSFALSDEDNSANEEQILPCETVNETKDFVNSDDHIVFKSTDSDDNSSQSSQNSDVFSTSKQLQITGVPSTRKAISPTSQEQLLLALKADELFDNTDLYKCKEKLDFVKESSSFGTVNGPENTVQLGKPVKSKQKKVIITTSQLLKKSRYERRVVPQKGNLEGPRLSRSIPFVTSENLSETAIAFSQRQMRDMEALTLRLTNEIKSMKALVEEKLLFESYRSLTLKNDAEEVKQAIKSATKAEETAKKFLSMMSRDCNRFCKVTKLNHSGPAVRVNEIREEKKKITFADEAGGTLCHVKFFENGVSSMDTCNKEEDEQIVENRSD